MARRYDRAATLTAVVNAVVVYLAPVAAVMMLMAFRSNAGVGTTVVGVDPDRAGALARRVRMIGGYLAVMSPFAMAAAWRRSCTRSDGSRGRATAHRAFLKRPRVDVPAPCWSCCPAS
jgi:hypothetical protein